MQKEKIGSTLEMVEEIMIEIVIDATIGIVAMTVIEIMTAPVAMIQGGENVQGPGSAGINE